MARMTLKLPLMLLAILWRWRGFLMVAVKRDLLSRYSGASLGEILGAALAKKAKKGAASTDEDDAG